MAKRGKRATKIIKAPNSRTRQDIRRILRKAGSLERYYQWGKGEQEAIEREKAQEEFDNAFLPGLAEMEKYWKHQRSPEAKRIFKQRTREQGRKERLLPRKEIIGATIEAFWKEPDRSNLDQIKDPAARAAWENWRSQSLGQSKEAIKQRWIRKLREGKFKPPR